MRILLPKRRIDWHRFEYMHLPYVYFVGPVLGGGDWQVPGCHMFSDLVGDCIIAVPCRWEHDHPLARYFIAAPIAYTRQLFWEQPSMKVALERSRSCVMAWMPEESETEPRTDGNPYGIDTLGEMNYFRGLLEHNKDLRVVAGAEPGFPRFTQIIKPNWDYSYGKPFPFQASLEATVHAAADLVMR